MMKRLFILSVIVALSGSLLASCSKEPVVMKGPIPSDNPIEFGVPQTKGAAELSTLERLATQKFGVNAWYTPEGETFGTESSSYIQNHCFGFIDPNWCGVTTAGDADPVYYPLDGTLTYFCYAPYRADVSDASDIEFIYNPSRTITNQLTNYLPGSPIICFTPSILPATQIDFVVSSPLLDVHRSQGSIPLDFTKHMTTGVQLWFKYSGSLEAGEGVMISQITLRGVIGSEYLYYTEEDGTLGYAWNSTIPPDGGDEMPVTSYTLSTANSDLITTDAYLDSSTPKYVNNTVNGRLYLLPQTLPAGAAMDITYVVKNISSGTILSEDIISVSLSGTTDWPIYKNVKYTITVGVAPRQVVECTASIIDWIDSGYTHTAQEIMY